MKRMLLALALCSACNRGGSPAPASRLDAASSGKPHAQADARPAEHDDEPEEHEALPSRVSLSAQVIRDAGIKSTAIVTEALPTTVDLTGEVVADPDRSARIAVRLPGRIVDVRFKEGDRVAKGAVLVVLESPELARARAAYAGTVARAKTARKNAERLQNVAQKGLAAGQEVAAAESEAQAQEADARAARQTLTALGPSAFETGADAAQLVIRAPIAGHILTRDAVRGQTVTAEHIVTTIADLDRAYFTARLFEKDLAKVQAQATAEVRLNAYPSEVFIGTVETVGRQLDPTARTVLARIALKNRADRLKVGLFGTARVVVADSEVRAPRPVVPLAAVTKIADKDVVFIRQPDDHFEVHPVTLGRTAAGKAEVIAGVRAGEQVVVEGVFTLKSAVLKSTFGEED